MARFVTLFVVILLALFALEMLPPVQEYVVQPFTSLLAHLSAALILPFDNSVVAHDRVLQFKESGFAVSIDPGCNGIAAAIVLTAAIIAFPARWRVRLAAIVLGFFAIQLLNLLRIISLFYLGNWDSEVFTWIHKYLWPVLIVLEVLLVFIVYLRYLSGGQAKLKSS